MLQQWYVLNLLRASWTAMYLWLALLRWCRLPLACVLFGVCCSHRLDVLGWVWLDSSRDLLCLHFNSILLDQIGVFVWPLSLVNRILLAQSESELLLVGLVVGCLWHVGLLKVGVVKVVLNASWGWRCWLYLDLFDILDRCDSYLFYSTLLARSAPIPGRLGWVWTVASTTTAHKGCIVAKLEAFVGFSWAYWFLLIGHDFLSGESFLKLAWAIQGWVTAWIRLTGLLVDCFSYCLADDLLVIDNWVLQLWSWWLYIWFPLDGDWVSNLLFGSP